MNRRRTFAALAAAAVIGCHAPHARAQEGAVAGPGRPSPVEFRYGWTGGISPGPDGRARVSTYPRVVDVVPSSPAAQAGLRAGDTIVSVNGRDGMSPPLFENVRAGTRVVIRIRRSDEEREISFVPREPPPR